ncbi:MAG: aminoglycoside phosphotransferase family protein [Candidatus Aminicenantes bacterium]|nr:aminoglycoside phosphotransferase family protein [Candidatus Aminicenantes bacterium]
MKPTAPAFDLTRIIPCFEIEGEFLDAGPYGTGHINDTYASRFRKGGAVVRYIHQRVNPHVFKRPDLVMANVERVTKHLRRKVVAAAGNPDRETLNLVPTRDGATFCRDEEGHTWRTYLFIEYAHTYDLVRDHDLAREAAFAFGRFQRLVADLPGDPLSETIPDFHNTVWRYSQFLEAVERDRFNRAAAAKAEFAFIKARAAETSRLVDLHREGRLPLRNTHNDTKFNNVMIDERTRAAVCVIDLDTVMPGFGVVDFGECVRTGAATAVEDERDLAKVKLDLAMFEALAGGFLEATSGFLSPLEVELLPFACRLMTLENGMRFLTDHLSGDVYYKIRREGHNLDRARTQLRLVEEMERVEEAMAAAIVRLG